MLQSVYPYHIGARCINKDWFALPIETVWQIFSNELFFVHHAFNARIVGFVLMSNHFHLILFTPLANLDKIAHHLLRTTSLQFAEISGRQNQWYGGPHFRCMITNDHYFSHAYKYMYCNPTKAGLANRAEDYPFSTLSGLLGKRAIHIPMIEDSILFSDVKGNLDWLNSKPNDDHWSQVSKALSRSEFKLSKCKLTKRSSVLEDVRL